MFSLGRIPLWESSEHVPSALLPWWGVALSLQSNPTMDSYFVVSIIIILLHLHTCVCAHTHRHTHMHQSLWLSVIMTLLEHCPQSSEGRKICNIVTYICLCLGSCIVARSFKTKIILCDICKSYLQTPSALNMC